MSNRFEDRPYFQVVFCKYKSKDNRALNENLDKIKFPFYCTYGNGNRGANKGMVHKTTHEYMLFNMNKQVKDTTLVCSSMDLKGLIETYNLNILKGKLLLFQKERR